jgi:hypothetical protein
MLSLLVAATLTLPASCEARCASDADRCYANCNGSAKCSRHCGDRSKDCSAQCAKQEAKREARADAQAAGMIPCGSKKGKDGRSQLVPCSDAESKELKDAMSSAEAQKALKCRDERGNPTPCKEDLEKADDVVKAVGSDGICAGPDGKPTLCPEAQQRVEKSLNKR